MLRTHTGGNVTLGHPIPQAPGLYVWPWRVAPLVGPRPPRRHLAPIDPELTSDLVLTVHFLLVVLPPHTDDGLSMLEAAAKAIMDAPILNVDNRRAVLAFSTVDDQTLISLFRSASLPVTVSLSAMITMGEPTEADPSIRS